MTANQFLDKMAALDAEIQEMDRRLLQATVYAHPKITQRIANNRATMLKQWEDAWRTRIAGVSRVATGAPTSPTSGEGDASA